MNASQHIQAPSTEMAKNIAEGRPPLWAMEILDSSDEQLDDSNEDSGSISWDTNQDYYDILYEALAEIQTEEELFSLWHEVKNTRN